MCELVLQKFTPSSQNFTGYHIPNFVPNMERVNQRWSEKIHFLILVPYTLNCRAWLGIWQMQWPLLTIAYLIKVNATTMPRHFLRLIMWVELKIPKAIKTQKKKKKGFQFPTMCHDSLFCSYSIPFTCQLPTHLKLKAHANNTKKSISPFFKKSFFFSFSIYFLTNVVDPKSYTHFPFPWNVACPIVLWCCE